MIQNTALIQTEEKVSLLLRLFPQPRGFVSFAYCQNILGLSSLFAFLVNKSAIQLQSASAGMNYHWLESSLSASTVIAAE